MCRPSEGPLKIPSPPILSIIGRAYGHKGTLSTLFLRMGFERDGVSLNLARLAFSLHRASVHGCCDRKLASVDAGRFTNARHGLAMPTHTVPA